MPINRRYILIREGAATNFVKILGIKYCMAWFFQTIFSGFHLIFLDLIIFLTVCPYSKPSR